MPREGQGIIFFDELNLADDTVRAACYQFILEGRYSNLPPVLDKDNKEAFWRVAASNQENDFCNVNNTSLALLRRFVHAEIVPDTDEILEYFVNKEYDLRVVSYLKAYPDDMFPLKWDESLLEKKSNPFPYAWETAAKLITGKQDSKLVFNFVSLCVGPEVATKFKAYVQLTEKLDLDKFIKEPVEYLEKIKKEDSYLSIIHSLIYSVAEKWKNSKISADILMNILKALDKEYTAALLKLTIKHRYTTMQKHKDLFVIAKELGILLENF